MADTAPPTPSLYDLYDRLDKLEELLEDMAELSVSSAVEAEQEILKLNGRIDALEAADGAPEQSA